MISSAQGGAAQHCRAARLAGGPQVSAPDKAGQRLADWLAQLEPMQSAAIRELAARFPFANRILLGIAEDSPYLFDLVLAEVARTIRLLKSKQERNRAELIKNTCRDVS